MRLLVVAMTATGCGFELDLGAGAIDAPDAIDSIDAIEIDAAVPCVASEFPRCAGEDVEICVAGVTTRMECGFGCVETLPVRCGDPVPSNSVSPTWIPAAPLAASLMVGPTQLLVADTDSGQIRICGGGDLRAAGTGVIAGIEFRRINSGPNDHGVFALESLTVAAGATLRLIGDIPGTVIANGPIVIDGVLDLSGGGLSCNMTTACGMVGDRRCSGPGPGLGGGDTQDGAGVGRGAKGGSGSGNEHGGGGGGFGALGGKGGGSGGGAAGSVYGTATLTPLLAGSGGGGGASGGSITQFGGGGGGGLQLTSMTSMQIGGTIIASGAGGGYGGNMFTHGGGGGGSGGAILLEATNLTISGAVTANGGGGGAGSAPPSPTSNGQDGRADAIAAFGGSGGASLVGGAGGSLPVPGGRRGFPDNSVSTDGSGGGGGGAGRIYMRARAGGITITGTVSPAPGFASDYLQ